MASSRGEVGVSGNLDTNGYVGDDYLAELDGASGREIYDRMRRSDDVIGQTLEQIELPIRRAEYRMEPASDSARDIEIAEFIGEALFQDLGTRERPQTWEDVVRHALLMLPFGFSLLEKVWKLRGGKWTVPFFGERLPSSVGRWEIKDRGLIGPIQTDSDGNEILLPIEKMLLFNRSREGDNYEGISILRRSYKAFTIKEDAEKINAISLDRFGAGVPVMKVPGGVKAGSTEWGEVEDLLESFYVNEQAYIIEPEGFDFRIEGVGGGGNGKGVDPLPTIKHYNEAIAKTMLQMFMNLGTSQSGSRALGGDFIKFFHQAEQAQADYIVSVFNRFLVPEWVSYNWSGVLEMPRMQVSRIEDLSLEALAMLGTAGLITPDQEVENAIRRQQHLPETKADEPADETVEREPAPSTEDEEEEPPAVEPGDVEQAVAAHLLDLGQMHERQAASVASQLLNGKAIPHVAVPEKREAFDLIHDQLPEDADGVVASLLVEEISKNLVVYVARAFNLLRRRRSDNLPRALGDVAKKMPHADMLQEAARYIGSCFPAMADDPDPDWEELDKPLRPIEKRGARAARDYFEKVERRMKDDLGDF